jgi:hypothetical protein
LGARNGPTTAGTWVSTSYPSTVDLSGAPRLLLCDRADLGGKDGKLMPNIVGTIDFTEPEVETGSWSMPNTVIPEMWRRRKRKAKMDGLPRDRPPGLSDAVRCQGRFLRSS